MGTIHVAVLDDNEEFLHGFAKMLAEEFHNCNIDAKSLPSRREKNHAQAF